MTKETAIDILRAAFNIVREVEFDLAKNYPGEKEAGDNLFEAEKLISLAVQQLCVPGKYNQIIEDRDIIYDGFGSAWSSTCPECGQKTMEVVRPGKVQCGNCG